MLPLLAALGLLGGSLGNKGGGGGAVAAPANPDIYSQQELDPILKDLFASIDRSGSVSWQNMFRGLQDEYQRRGLGGSGIEFQNESEAARQNALDTTAQKQSAALNLYNSWLQRRGQDQNYALAQQQRADNQSQLNQQKRGQFWNTAGQVAGMFMNK